MFCPKCGTNVNENMDFCPNCGANLKEIKEKELENENNINIQNNSINQQESVIIDNYQTKQKINISKYKKQIKRISMLLIIIVIGILLYKTLYGFEKLSWNNLYVDSNLKYVTQTNLNLGVNFSNNNKVNDIKYKTNCGNIKVNNLEVTWDLNKAIGKCKIIASYKLKKIKKIVYVTPYNVENKDMNIKYTINTDSDEDLDYDKLTNKQEKKYKTDPELADTDLDGLDDYYEIFTSKTNPNKKDSDNDGLSDYDEIELELDPLKADSKNDGIKDGKRELTYNYESSNMKISITGSGNIASIIAEVNENTKISGKEGFIDKLYTLYTEGTSKEAILTLNYTDEELTKYQLNEDNLSIYYYNSKEPKYEKIPSTINKTEKTVTAKLKHFSNYILGDTTIITETPESQVLFVLDNSWSMYTNEQYEKYTGKKYTGGLFESSELDGFDADGVRFTLTSDLATRLSKKNYKIGLSEFRSDYKNAYPIGSNVKRINKTLKEMTGKFITQKEGTNISNALNNSIEEFEKNSNNKYIIILTDGQDDSLSSNTEKIITKATKNDVKICSIGFGGGSYNIELSNISNATGCKFYSSSDSNGLEELFENIKTELDDDLVDIDNDNKADGILIADSEFIVNRDGFSFPNYTSNLTNGHCYGMATFAELYYKKVLPLASSKNVDDKYLYYYNLSNTYFEKFSNLYDYKLKTNSLKYCFGFDAFNENKPSDYRKLKWRTLIINDKYKKEIEKLYDINKEKTSLTRSEQLKKYGFNYDDAENPYLNENLMQTYSEMDNNDLQVLNAIYISFLKQKSIAHYSSSSDYILWARNVLKTEEIDYTGGKAFINILKSRLKDKDAPVISSDFSGGLHAINAISLIQDIDNPNIYYIGVYDNNYPGEKRYVNIKCNKNYCVTTANKYYTKSNEPVRVTPSLEQDLSYYK